MSKIPLNEFITLQRGFDLPSNKRISGSVPVVASTGIAGYHNEIKVKAPGVVIGRSGSIGGGQYIEKDFFPLNTTLYVKDFKGHYPRFIYYLLKSIDFTSFNVGTGVPTLNRNHLSSILISDLGIEKEKEIANILGSLDQKIQLNTQINQTLEQIAQALFKSWFVDFDPVRAKVQALSDGLSLEQAELAAIQAISGKTPEELTALSQTQPERYAELAETAKAFPCEMVEVDGVEVPKGWEVKALDEIANYQNGLALQKFRPEDDEPFLPVVKIAQLRQGYADGDEKAKANIKPECIIDNGDVIFSWSGSLLVDIWCGGKAALNQHLFKVSSKEYPKWFYYFYTKHHLTEFQRIAYDKAVTMGHIKREHLSAAKCIVPNDELLANKTLENILEKIIFNRLENFNLQNTRDLLLPRLLNGELNG
ncbi:restriction endonuclease subunit S [Haemophilus influenzae]|uniref:Restriction endonuclease subunit S n=4 Tax=Haemophilus influenzae TaxID=727 RepID=A0A2S9S4T8_HAEIF|nr:restriction endonuclease subunit S [Haemophilus influenzae]AAX88607.1 putative type I restriction enzyme HindVIIP specificity protein [Haemophilus influenzae 86-028NP]AIT67841.1 restriction endonuclease subunit S [Haemophilus influenzae]AJO90720.1 putative nucleotidyltransferase [Haemophilus influenzae]AXP40046.1 restriction endonuclease subunit S [Haemophilus influenzae]AXP46221.1 restriction endonuclease subunit S [Haemophilus influenzae]